MSVYVVLATLALLAAGGLVTWQAVNHHGGLDSATARLHSSSPVASSPVASSRGTSPPPAGDDAVAIAPAVAQNPLARQVAALLRNYFRSINRHDFEEYDGLFVPQLRGSVQNFNAGYRLTTDSGATLTALSATGPQDLAATVSFTSHQNPADSPDQAACDTWQVILSLTHVGDGYLIERSPPGPPALRRNPRS